MLRMKRSCPGTSTNHTSRPEGRAPPAKGRGRLLRRGHRDAEACGRDGVPRKGAAAEGGLARTHGATGEAAGESARAVEELSPRRREHRPDRDLAATPRGVQA